jgi:1-acyl-sn-glycerol-3-phosphate acyltransferase
MAFAFRLFQTSRRLPGRPAWSVIFWWILVAYLVRTILTLVYGLIRRGEENVPLTGPVIYVANHQSHYDPPIIGSLVTDRPFSSLARSGLFHNRIFAWLIRQLGAVSIEQGRVEGRVEGRVGGRGDAGAIRTALRELESGRCLLIFAEGTRTPDGTVQEFQRGVYLLLRRARVPVIPIAVEGVYDIWPIGQIFPRLTGRMAVMAGSPIPAQELIDAGEQAALDRLRREVDSMRLQLRAELRRRTNGRYPARGPADAQRSL